MPSEMSINLFNNVTDQLLGSLKYSLSCSAPTNPDCATIANLGTLIAGVGEIIPVVGPLFAVIGTLGNVNPLSANPNCPGTS